MERWKNGGVLCLLLANIFLHWFDNVFHTLLYSVVQFLFRRYFCLSS